MITTTTVEKARISKLSKDVNPQDASPQGTDTIYVQFNPTSLKISRSNNPDRPDTTLGQGLQHTGPQPATLTFDLEFDTGEMADTQTGMPMDVRVLTAEVRKFVLPGDPNKTGAPPSILFEWGPLSFPGVVTNLTEDIDYFAPDGTPLRAKLSVTIQERDLKFEANVEGAGAVLAANATKPGEPPSGAMPGTRGTGSPTSLVAANAGESLQELLTRIGADPSAWRAAMNGLSSPIGLGAGAQVQLDAAITAGAGLTASAGAGAALGGGSGLGVSTGFSASAGVSAQASLAGALGVSASAEVSAGAAAGISGAAGAASAELSAIASLGGSVGVTAGGSVGASEQMSAGFALAAGGGIAASANLVAAAGADAEVTSVLSSFDVPVERGSGALGVPAVALPSAAAAVVDTRATSYGRSIPLRARASAITVNGVAADGPVSISARAQPTEIVVSSAGPPWQRLTDDGGRRRNADALQRSRDDGPTTMRWTPGR